MQVRILGVVILIAGILIVLTPWYIFPVCEVGKYAPAAGAEFGGHRCHNTVIAENILGVMLILAGIAQVFFTGKKVIMGSSLFVIVSALLVILLPVTITGICKMQTMPCRYGTFPAFVVQGIILGIIGMAGVVISRKAE